MRPEEIINRPALATMAHEQWELNFCNFLFVMDYKTDQEFRENIKVRNRTSPVLSLKDYPVQNEFRERTQVLLDYIAQRPAGKRLFSFCTEVVGPWYSEVVARHAKDRNPLQSLTLVRINRIGSDNNGFFDAPVDQYQRSMQDWLDISDRQDVIDVKRNQYGPSRMGAAAHDRLLRNFDTNVRRLREWAQEFLASERELAKFLEDANIQIQRYCQPYYLALQTSEMKSVVKAVRRNRASNPGATEDMEED